MDEKIYILENDLLNVVCIISLTSCLIGLVVLYAIDLFFRKIPEVILRRLYQRKWIGKIEDQRLRIESLEYGIREVERNMIHLNRKLDGINDERTTPDQLDKNKE